MPCPLEQVRASCARVLSQLERHVKVHPEAAAALGRRFVSEEAAANGGEFPSLEATAAIWAADGMHLVRPDDEELTARCVLVRRHANREARGERPGTQLNHVRAKGARGNRR